MEEVITLRQNLKMLITNILLPILNKLLRHNEGSRNRLKSYQGKSFNLNIIGFYITGVINNEGFIARCNQDANVDGDYDIAIIVPASIASYFIHNDKLEVFRQITFHGDTKFGRDLLEILSNLHFEGVYATLSPLNGLILQQLAKVFAGIKDYFILVNKNMATSVSEYLLYESRDIVTSLAIEEFCVEVDELKSRTDLLAKKVNQLITIV